MKLTVLYCVTTLMLFDVASGMGGVVLSDIRFDSTSTPSEAEFAVPVNTSKRASLSMSLHAGLHSAGYDNYADKRLEMIGAYHFGASVTIPTAHPQLSIETGVMYTPKGMRENTRIIIYSSGRVIDSGLVITELRKYSLEVPLTLLYDINPGSSSGVFRLRLGASIGFRLGDRAEYISIYDGEEIGRRTGDITDHYFKREDVIYSITGGIEYEIHNIRASIHYMAGQSVMRHRLFGFTVGYRIL